MMEKNENEPATSKSRLSSFNFVMKALLLVLCVFVVVLFVLVAKCFSSLSTLSDRLNSLEEENSLNLRSENNEKQEASTNKRRSKRNTDETKIDKALTKLDKPERRFNQTYQYKDRHPLLLARGPLGKPGNPGSQGPTESPGIQGTKGYPELRAPRGYATNVGVVYIRWGKKTCPNTGAQLVYRGYRDPCTRDVASLLESVRKARADRQMFFSFPKVEQHPKCMDHAILYGKPFGYVGGASWSRKGGGSNYVCLTRDPIYAKYQPGYQNVRAQMYGAEYETFSAGIYPSSLHDHDVPCAVCYVTRRASQMMIPGRNVCPAGWTREYKGYLMAEYHNHPRTMFTCVDEYPDYTPGTHADVNGALFYFVEGVCGSLPCMPYIGGRELTCALCTR